MDDSFIALNGDVGVVLALGELATLKELEAEAGEADLLAFLDQNFAIDADAIDEGPVAGAEIFNQDAFGRAGEVGMGSAALALGPGLAARRLLAEEPRITVSPLNKLSDEDEIALGQRFAAELEKEEETISNGLIDRYLGKIVYNLAAKSQRPELPFFHQAGQLVYSQRVIVAGRISLLESGHG
jgi:hypothetical protein